MPSFFISKSVSINAPIEDVFSVISDFKSWPKWSPWLISEPDCRLEYAADGKSYSWDGKIVGAGEMEKVVVEEQKSIDYQLTFLKPWKSTSKVRFVFEEKGGEVVATWTMEGSLPFFLFWMKKMMVAMIGMDYSRGLAMLKEFLETGGVNSKLDFVGLNSFSGYEWVGIRNRCALSDIGEKMEADFGRLWAWVGENSVEVSGKPFSIYHKWEMVKGYCEYTIGAPVGATPIALGEGMVSGSAPDMEVFAIKHTGSYKHLGNAWSAGMMRQQNKVFKSHKKQKPFEVYDNNPSEVSERELETSICFPVS